VSVRLVLPATLHILASLHTMVNWYLWNHHHLACVTGGKVLGRGWLIRCHMCLGFCHSLADSAWSGLPYR